jgi:hypothetical protein
VSIGSRTANTKLEVYGTASSSGLVVSTLSGLLKANGTSAVTVATPGVDYSTSLYPFPATGNATGTLTQFNGGLTSYASTTIGNGTATGGLTVAGTATTTNLKVTSVTSALHLADSTGNVTAYAGTSCTNQFIRSMNGSGVATCASVNLTSDITGTLAYANGGTGTTTAPVGQLLYGGTSAYQSVATTTATIGSSLSYSGTFGALVGGAAGTLSLNLNNANTWTALQTFNYSSSTIYSSFLNASSTNLFAGSATNTNLSITGIASGNLLKTTTGGYVVPAVAGADYANFGYLFPNNATTTGLGLYASTTIGAGTQATGLTISGGATTTGNAYFAGNVGVGSSSPAVKLVVSGSTGSGTTVGPNTDLYLDNNSSHYIQFGAGSGATTGLLFGTGANYNIGSFTFNNTTNAFTLAANPGNVNTFTSVGVGIGTSTPQYLLNPFSASAPQLSLSAGAGLAQWAFRNAGGNFYLSTTTVAGTATTSTAAFSIAGSGFGTTTVTGLAINGQATSTSNVGFNLTGGCFAIGGNCISGGGGSGTVSSATQGQFAFYNANGTTVSGTSTLFVAQNTNVGVGSTTPWAKLSVDTSNLLAGVPEFAVGSSTRPDFFISQSGNISIGTTTNDTKFILQDPNVAISTYQKIFRAYAPNINPGDTVQFSFGTMASANNVAEFNFVNVATGSPSNRLGLGLYGVPSVMSITGASTVGIGTTTPWAMLQIATTTGKNLVLSDSGAGANLKHWMFSSQGGIFSLGTTTDAYATSSPAALTILSNGDMGIGSTTPWADLSISNENTSGPTFAVGSNANATQFLVTGAGNVGISTTTPWAKLSIHANNGDTNGMLFAIASSTASATSTLFSVSNTGSTTLFQIPSSILKTNSNGTIVAAVSGTDYLAPGSAVTSVSGTWPIISSGGTTPTISWGGLSTTTNLTTGNLVYASGVGSLTSVATTSATIGSSLSYSGTFGALVGGAAGTLSLNLGNVNTWTALQTFLSASSTYFGAYNAVFGGTASTTFTSTGYVGVATSTPFYALTVASSTAAQFALSAGAGIAQWTLRNAGGNFYLSTTTVAGNATSSLPALAITGSGAVGIGTSTPMHALDVLTNSTNVGGVISLFKTSLNDYTGFQVQNSTAAWQFSARPSTDPNASGFNFYYSPDGVNNWVSPMALTSGGLVGVGTNTPQYLLSAASSTAPQLSLSAGAGLAQWAFRNAGGNFYLSTTTVAGTATTSSAAFSIAGGGFGTTTITGLSINGQATSTSNVGFNLSGGCFAINGTCVGGAGGGSGTVSSATQGQFAFYNANGTTVSGTSTLFVSQTSLVGVGTSTPWAKLSVDTSNLLAGVPEFAVGSSTRPDFFISQSGNISIGTTTNDTKFILQDPNVAISTYQKIFRAYAPNINPGDTVQFSFGTMASANNVAEFNFVNVATGSPSNRLGLGLYGVPSVLSITGASTVGIGTTTPFSMLAIATTTGKNLVLSDSGAGTNLKHWLFSSQGGIFSLGTTTDAYATSSPAAFTILSNGDMGIGSTTPWADFSISNENTSGPTFAVGSNTNATQFLVTGAGNIGVGTSTPWARLSLDTSNLAAGVPEFSIGSSTRQDLVITQAGFLGLGTTTPRFLFHASTTDGDIGIGDITAGSASTNAGLVMTGGGTSTSALFTEVTGSILSLGINVPQITTRNTSTSGGIFRFDTRTGTSGINGDAHAFVVKRFAQGSSVEQNALIVDLDTGSTALTPTGGNVGISTTTPWAKLSIHANNGDTNGMLFAIASSTASATSTLFSVSNTGSTTLFQLPSSVLTTSANGTIVGTTSIGVAYGGTGLTSVASSSVLIGGPNNTMIAMATSSLGLQAAGTYITSVSGTWPIISTGGTTPSISWGGLSTTSNLTTGNLVYASGIGSLTSVATTSATIGSSLSYSGTFGALVGGANGTLALNLSNANTWTALQTFSNASSTLFSSTYASSTNLFAGSATTSNLSITGIGAGNILKTATGGYVVPAVAGTDYANFGYLFPSAATNTLLAFNGGLTFTNATGTSLFTNLHLSNTLAVGQTGTTTITSAGFVGVGTTSPWGMLSINPNGITGPAFAIGSSTATNFVVTNGGSVGIGTTSPIATLAVQGAGAGSVLAGAWGGNSAYGGISLNGSLASGNTNFYGSASDATLYINRPTGGQINFRYAGADQAVLTTGGSFGLGTTTPSALLALAGTSGIYASTTATSTFQGGGINIVTAAGNTGCFAINGTCVGGAGGGSGTVASGLQGQFAFYDANGTTVSGTSTIFVTRANMVGVGTTTSPWAFEVAGTRPTFALSDASAAANLKHWLFSSMGGNLYIGTSTDAYATSSPSVLSLLNAGQVGIGTSTPFRKLSVTDTVANAQVAIAYDASRYTQLQTDSTGGFHINPSSGNTGVQVDDGNMLVCAGGSCPTGLPAGTGNLVVETTLGIGTSTSPFTVEVAGTRPTLAISDTGSGGTNSKHWVFSSQGGNLYVGTTTDAYATSSPSIISLLNAGNMGLGTSTPWSKLTIGAKGAITTTENQLTDAGTITVSWKDGNQQVVTLGGNRTINFSNYVAGSILRLVVCQDGTGSRTVTWDSNVLWSGGSAPTLTTTANKCDVASFLATGATSTLKMLGTTVLNF